MPATKALIVDDEADIRELVELTLSTLGIDCSEAENLGQARELLRRERFSFCITDMRLPDGDGLDLIAYIQKHHPELPVAMITAHGSVDTAVEALKLGAFDFVQKPVELTVLRNLAQSALRLAGQTHRDERALRAILGHSPAIEKVRVLIRKLARSQAPVLIHGESGTGKELAARAIHGEGPRADRPFVPVNCGAIPEHLLESEFFGHSKGSFTGASRDKPGLFQAADSGTLFLDEVGELPPAMQVKLLRAIQERAVRPVGEQREVPVDVRILSATNRDLGELVRASKFRQDLFYRLNVIELPLPPLRKHVEDIPELAETILDRLSAELQQPKPKLTSAALAALREYSFPGNIRELENILERAFTLCEGPVLDAEDLYLPTQNLDLSLLPEPRPAPRDDGQHIPDLHQDGLETYLEELERDAIMQALEATRFNKTAAAEKLGISFRALRYRLKKLGID